MTSIFSYFQMFLLYAFAILIGVLLLIGVSTIFAEPLLVTAWVIDGNDYRQVPMYFGNQTFINDNCHAVKKGMQGCWLDPRIHPVEAIFIVTEKAIHYPNYGGCNVVWHELSHAMGYDHEWMFKNLPNKDCSYHYQNRHLFY